MLEIKHITKTYKTEGFEQKALDRVSVNFRKCEFASILGPSGSGKTTFLNIIGGLDHYDSGDLVINEVSTKKFGDREWDSYRNHRVGFVFQSYNLIGHQTVLSNVELALTLSGISKEERKEKALKALKDVGLSKHVHKKPNQLSGGQMQRVAIARALVNDPEIILADEPTGALDSETSVQIMGILKEVSKNKLVIMVTHNPELAEAYSSRIIHIKDGKIVKDTNPYDGKINTSQTGEEAALKSRKTKMSFRTALGLSFHNLMTKKGRTILVAAAGSIGIIGIALILAVSTGFQNYVDSIQEETLTSYPLTITQEATDISGMLLSMTSSEGVNDGTHQVVEKQYITSMLSSVSTNDLKSFKKYLEEQSSVIHSDISNIVYQYSIDPLIYSVDSTNKIVKLNPSSVYSSMMGGNSLMGSFSSMGSIYSQMIDSVSDIQSDYDVLAGSWPKNYDEMIVVLSEPNSISDLLVYSLGLRDTEKLTTMITKIMSGESVLVDDEPMTLSYEDLMNLDLRLIMPSDLYSYNKKYDVYEDMSGNSKTVASLYEKALHLKIVGVVAPKEGSSTRALSPGVSYTSGLIQHIIDYAASSDIVKKQIQSAEIDVFSGNRFDAKNPKTNFSFSDLVKVDQKKIQSSFGMTIDQHEIEKKTEEYMNSISSRLSVDTSKATHTFSDGLTYFAAGLLKSLPQSFALGDIDSIVSSFLASESSQLRLAQLEETYVLPVSVYETAYSGLLKGLLSSYISGYTTYMVAMNPAYSYDLQNPSAFYIEAIGDSVMEAYFASAAIEGTCATMGATMSEALMKKSVLSEVGGLTSYLTSSFATAFHLDQNKLISAFSLNFSEDELSRVVSAMMNDTKTTQKTNLIHLGYQDLDEPTFIQFYFSSFEGKERFISFIDSYNASHTEEQEIKYSDTTGILMDSVKTIVNAVSYVLIAFVSISLVVSSIMIGVITYISVYERTKEIGVLRAIGASKGNISSIFNAETFIIGFLSGFIGIGFSYLAIPVINKVLHHFTGNVPLSASLPAMSALLLIALAVLLTIIGGLIPSKMASKKDPVEALRSE